MPWVVWLIVAVVLGVAEFFTLTLAWSVGPGVPVWLSGAPFLLAALMLAAAGVLSAVLIARLQEAVPLGP